MKLFTLIFTKNEWESLEEDFKNKIQIYFKRILKAIFTLSLNLNNARQFHPFKQIH